MTIESNRQDIASIQMLRGIAALMVVFVHLDVQLRRYSLGAIDSSWLVSGVDIFFVISGFIMWVTTARAAHVTGTKFMINRLIRIVPLYWAVSLFVLATAIMAPQLLHTTTLEPIHALASFLFIPARHPVTGQFWPLLVPGWTLNYEMLFYVLFAISIAAGNRSLGRRLAWLFGLIASVLVVASATRSGIDVMNFYANPMMFEFLAGTLLAIVYASGRVAASWLWFGAILVGFLLLWRGMQIMPAGVPAFAPGAILVVAGGLFSPPVRITLLQRIGDASYSLYLTHVITLAIVATLWSRQSFLHGAIVFGAISLVAALVAAMVCYRLFERPVTAWLKRIDASAGYLARSVAPTPERRHTQ